jgi:hypothetical protein
VGEQQEVIDQLAAAQVLPGIRWAYRSAVARALADYSESAGYDATSLGMSRFTLFRDRLDRVFACGKYAVPDGTDGRVSVDVLEAELTEEDVRTMPHLPPDLVRSAPLNGSPGWAWQGLRWLLASCTFGHVDDLPWSQKSPTKQRVASQLNPDPNQASLFEGMTEEEVGGIQALLAAAKQLDLDTFVVAHSLDPLSGDRELVFGRAQLNPGGGRAWHWRHDLLGTPPTGGGRRVPELPPPTGPDSTSDAPVRLRRPAAEQPDAQPRGAE